MVCAAVCPESCIAISLDQDGYPVATADDAACAQCGQCGNVCFKFQHFTRSPHPLKSYVGFNKTESIRMMSSSGGIGTALAQKALESGYAVVGAELNLKNRRVEHVILNDVNELHRIRGSKYFPSHTKEAFAALKNMCKAVIFGTPCQISGLRRAYPDKDFLYVDLKCFGPMGCAGLEKYLKFLDEFNASGIKSINFRGKDVSWKMWGPHVEFNDGRVYSKTYFNDPFGRIFNIFYGVHQVCLSCDHFKNTSDADIRMEDAWKKMEIVTPESWKKGLSQITVYTERGFLFLSSIMTKIEMIETTPTIVEVKSIKTPEKLLELLRNNAMTIYEIETAYDKIRSRKAKMMDKFYYFITLHRYFYMATYHLYGILRKLLKWQ